MFTAGKKAHVVETTCSRTRLNIMGALNLNDFGSTVIREYDTINSLSICQFFIAIREVYPVTQNVNIILTTQAITLRNWPRSGRVIVMNIELHWLPPYSPNLNPIERLWKVMNELVRKNHYFGTAKGFKENIRHFFSDILSTLAGNLSCRINELFQKMKMHFQVN
ncbi:hypothetical protein ADQ49_11380 [Salmonella enterica subsp. enterica]|uniref:Tc1-like transposase DDE domain-containing protein n=1 Tax=Salmonella enterica TaxID=28901 RepID=A0A742UFI1_SALER|nr:hypothetical protein [Salmonella enterica subsp. enterica serovar Enteritidis]HAF1615455.1 hypothetical protein [Salmonella enterica]